MIRLSIDNKTEDVPQALRATWRKGGRSYALVIQPLTGMVMLASFKREAMGLVATRTDGRIPSYASMKPQKAADAVTALKKLSQPKGTPKDATLRGRWTGTVEHGTSGHPVVTLQRKVGQATVKVAVPNMAQGCSSWLVSTQMTETWKGGPAKPKVHNVSSTSKNHVLDAFELARDEVRKVTKRLHGESDRRQAHDAGYAAKRPVKWSATPSNPVDRLAVGKAPAKKAKVAPKAKAAPKATAAPKAKAAPKAEPAKSASVAQDSAGTPSVVPRTADGRATSLQAWNYVEEVPPRTLGTNVVFDLRESDATPKERSLLTVFFDHMSEAGDAEFRVVQRARAANGNIIEVDRTGPRGRAAAANAMYRMMRSVTETHSNRTRPAPLRVRVPTDRNSPARQFLPEGRLLAALSASRGRSGTSQHAAAVSLPSGAIKLSTLAKSSTSRTDRRASATPRRRPGHTQAAKDATLMKLVAKAVKDALRQDGSR